MSDLSLIVGQTATSVATFSEAPPTDGAVSSDNTTFLTVTLDTDKVTWHATCIGAPADGSMGVANMTYMGTSVPPDTGPAVVPPVSFSCSLAPVAETGNLNPGNAKITG